MELIIKEEFKRLLPPLTSEEYKILEESLLVEGCRDPLITWEGILVDGHNRYDICKKHNIRFNTEDIEADSIEDIKIWIIDNQKGRRNLTDGWKYELAQVRKEILLKQGREKQGHGLTAPGKTLLSTIDKTDSHNTRNEIAEDLGWSTGKVAMADRVWQVPEIKERVKSGEISLNEAYKQIKKPLVSLFTGNNEWYTPGEYIELARKTMGSIDLDPASSEMAQKTVKAKKYFTIEDDGLIKEWKGNIWLNPPYSGKEVIEFIDKLIEEYKIKNVKQAVILTNDNTDTSWYHKLVKASSAICLLSGRIKFYNDSEVSAPTNGQTFFYLGDSLGNFKREFRNIGIIMTKYE